MERNRLLVKWKLHHNLKVINIETKIKILIERH